SRSPRATAGYFHFVFRFNRPTDRGQSPEQSEPVRGGIGMKRHRAWIIALVVIAAATVVFRLGRRPGDASQQTPPEAELEVTSDGWRQSVAAKLEFTPEGWQRLKAEYEAKGKGEMAFDIFLGPALRQGKIVEAYESVSPVDRPKLFETFAIFMVASRLSQP